jgi:hypothetical protein
VHAIKATLAMFFARRASIGSEAEPQLSSVPMSVAISWFECLINADRRGSILPVSFCAIPCKPRFLPLLTVDSVQQRGCIFQKQCL